jgi:hypothetical protein
MQVLVLERRGGGVRFFTFRNHKEMFPKGADFIRAVRCLFID